MTKRETYISAETPAELSEIPVTFGSGEVKLAGEILFPNAGHPVPGAVLCHGFGSSHRAVKAGARIIANHGVAVLIFDFRGHGASEGILDGNIVQDVVDAWHFLSEFPGVDKRRIALIGHSMGAMAAIMAARQVNPYALVALSCPPELDGKLMKGVPTILRKWITKGITVEDFPQDGAFPWLNVPFTVLSRLWMHLLAYGLRVDWWGFLDVLTKAKMSTALRELKDCATLFVHCEGDSLTPYQPALELYEKARQPKDLFLAKGGFHSAPLQLGGLRGGWTRWAVATLMAN
jgi:pimeloyl-ACP methyl ester carboxylesterase